MTGVVGPIGAAHAGKIVEVLRELLDMALDGQLVSLAVLAECGAEREPLPIVVGRYRADPARLLGELSVMQSRLTQHTLATRRERGFRHSI